MLRALITANTLLALLSGVSIAYAQSLPSLVDPSKGVATQSNPVSKSSAPVSATPSSSKPGVSVSKTPPVQKRPSELPPPSKLTQDFYNAVKSRNIDLADVLLRQGADINCTNCGDAPLLNWAASGQWIGVAPPKSIEWLLARGANPNVKDPRTGNTPLHHAVFNAIEFSKWSRELNDFEGPIREILDRGARADLQNDQGDSPLHFLARFVHYAHNPSITQFANYHMDRLVQAGGRMDQSNAMGYTPLINGVRIDLTRQAICNPKVIQHLLDLGSDPSARDKKGRTAYTIAYDLAVEGFKQCNPVLDMLSAGRPGIAAGTSIAPTKALTSMNKSLDIPAGLVGEYTGVLRIKSPAAMTLAVSGSIGPDGNVLLNAPRGFTNVGYLVSASPETLELRLKTRAPEGYRFANGQQETAEFTVKGQVTERIFKGLYEAPTDAGEFILCPNDIAQAQAACRPSFAESLNSVIGGFLGGK